MPIYIPNMDALSIIVLTVPQAGTENRYPESLGESQIPNTGARTRTVRFCSFIGNMVVSKIKGPIVDPKNI